MKTFVEKVSETYPEMQIINIINQCNDPAQLLKINTLAMARSLDIKAEHKEVS